MNPKLLLSSFAASILLLGACEGTSNSTNANYAPVRFGAALDSGTLTAAPGLSSQGTKVEFGRDITITSIKVALGKIDLRLKGPGSEGRHADSHDNDMQKADSRRKEGRPEDEGQQKQNDDSHPGEIEFAGPYLFDLTTQTATPSPDAVSIPTGIYKHIELTFQSLTATDATQMGLDASDSIVGNSYVIEGWLNNVSAPGVTQSTVKLVIFGSQEKTYHVNLKRGVAITAGSLNDLLLLFDANGWFPASLVGQLRSGLNEGSVTVDTSGSEPVVYLDANRNNAIAAQFNKLFHGGMKLVKDANGNHHADSDETPEQVGSDK